ncbi:MAG: TrkH family potassium uptake protein [Bacteroidales bacterium]|nr:TrkH family potassium uptake protein [Bacteroidales bacterium]
MKSFLINNIREDCRLLRVELLKAKFQFQRRISYRSIFAILGSLLMLEGIFMALGIPFALIYGNDHWPLTASAYITFTFGFFSWLPNRGKITEELTKREGYLIVTLTWIVISLFGTLPYFFSPYYVTITDAFFESMSGFTTTGASIIEDLGSVPESILFWRSMTQWIGGMGIIMLTLAIVPILGIAGFQLFSAETTGPQKNKIHPKVKGTVKRLWLIYLSLTLIQYILLRFGDMSPFQAICHSLSTVSTGGFSSEPTSIEHFSSYIQYVITVFMVLGGINFTIIYFLLRRNFKKIKENHELWAYLGIILVATAIITAGLFMQSGRDFEESFRHALFQVVSILTTTGFVAQNYLNWPAALVMILFMLMFIGGMTGSTSGGIKVYRQSILVKNSYLELKRLIHPNAIVPLTFSKKIIDTSTLYKIMSFFALYALICFFSIFVMSLLGLDFETSIGSVVASIGNIGPGIGKVGSEYSFAAIPNIGKWYLCFLMLLGRLELFTVLVLFTAKFWKK